MSSENLITTLLEIIQGKIEVSIFLISLIVFVVTAPGADPKDQKSGVNLWLSNFILSRIALAVIFGSFLWITVKTTTEVAVTDVKLEVVGGNKTAETPDFEITNLSVRTVRETEANAFYQASFALSADLPSGLVLVPIIEDGFSSFWLQGSGWVTSAIEGIEVVSPIIPVGKLSSYPLTLRYYAIPEETAQSTLNRNFGRVPSIEVFLNTPISQACVLRLGFDNADCS